MEKDGKCCGWVGIVNRVLLGLTMLIPGLIKLFVFKPSGVTAMLAGIGFPAASVFAWILIILEIASGIAILAKWQLKYTSIVPMVILLVAALTVHLGKQEWPIVLVLLTAVSNYGLLGYMHCHSEKE